MAVIMGSKSDWEVVSHAVDTLSELGVPHDVRVASAHRTPEALVDYVKSCEAKGVRIFIAAAGGAAHLAGVIASATEVPVLGVPMKSALDGLDSLLATVQMPAGIPVATFAIGKAGCINAALFATAILGIEREDFREAISKFRRAQREKILANPDPRS